MEASSPARRLNSASSTLYGLTIPTTAPKCPSSLPVRDANLLSPPITPVRNPLPDVPLPKMVFPPTPRSSLDEQPEALTPFTMTKTRAFKGGYSLNRRAGSGAWSDVYQAEQSEPALAATTPSKSLAIKTPSRKDARRVLSHEARVLTYLTSDPASSSHVIRFHGLEDDSNSLVLDYAPLTLSHHAQQCLNADQQRNPDAPVVGEKAFKRYARHLIKGLAEIHAKDIAHGDIKPENILLKPCDAAQASPSGTTAYEPVYCDFSSARLVVDDDVDGANADAMDALTPPYMSPELLASMSPRYEGQPIDRQKADVWALAVCLVALATGYEPYSELHAQPSYARLHWIRQGDVLGSVREHSGQARRIAAGGYVARTVRLALAPRPNDRVTARQWLDSLDEAWNIVR